MPFKNKKIHERMWNGGIIPHLFMTEYDKQLVVDTEKIIKESNDSTSSTILTQESE